MPKGALSIFQLWCKEERQAAEYAPLSFGEAMKALGAKWKTMDEATRAPWVEASKEDHARRKRADEERKKRELLVPGKAERFGRASHARALRLGLYARRIL